MKKRLACGLDHKKAVIVSLAKEREEIKKIESSFENRSELPDVQAPRLSRLHWQKTTAIIKSLGISINTMMRLLRSSVTQNPS